MFAHISSNLSYRPKPRKPEAPYIPSTERAGTVCRIIRVAPLPFRSTGAILGILGGVFRGGSQA